MITEESVYQIGHIARTHGVKGEVALAFTDDVWDRTESEYLILRIDGILVPFFMEEYRFKSDTTALIKFLGYDSSESARELCGCAVYFPYSLTPEENPDATYSWRHFTGFTVVDQVEGNLGQVDFVDDSTRNILFHVGTLMFPAVEAYIDHIDHQTRTIYVNLPSDLFNLNT